MSSRKQRNVSLFMLIASMLAVSGLFAPEASAEPGDLIVEITVQPTDAAAGELITGEPFNPSGGDVGYVQVRVREEQSEGSPLAVVDAEVHFDLADGTGLATTDELNSESRFTNSDGYATFGPEEDSENPLSIGDENDPLTTSYKLVPVVTPPVEEDPPIELTSFTTTSVSGPESDEFDIWGAGCRGQGQDCLITLNPGDLGSSDKYNTTQTAGMGVSTLDNDIGETTIDCPTQVEVFPSELVFHATTTNAPVFVVTHISRDDMKRIPQNGQKHIGWCIGLKSAGKWNFARQDTNGDTFTDTGDWVPGSDLWVGLAPKCPNKRTAPANAPCILSRMSDDLGGSFISGYLPGGDPTKRT